MRRRCSPNLPVPTRVNELIERRANRVKAVRGRVYRVPADGEPTMERVDVEREMRPPTRSIGRAARA